MQNIILHNYKVCILIIFFACIPQKIFASKLSFKLIDNKNTSDINRVIEVRMDPQSNKLNVVEGVIKFSGEGSENLSVQVENGKSILAIWPIPPEYDRSQKTIKFTGGIPNGFDSEGLLFNIIISPTVKGELNISFTDGNAYLNDGKGTKESIESDPYKININNITNSLPLYSNNYVIIIISLIALFIVIFKFKYFFKKNDAK